MKILMTIKKLLMLMDAYHVVVDDDDDDDDDDGQKLAQSCSWHCLSLAQAADKPRLARSWQRNLAFAIKIWTRLLSWSKTEVDYKDAVIGHGAKRSRGFVFSGESLIN